MSRLPAATLRQSYKTTLDRPSCISLPSFSHCGELMHQVLFLFFVVVVVVQANLITCERPTRPNLTVFLKKKSSGTASCQIRSPTPILAALSRQTDRRFFGPRGSKPSPPCIVCNSWSFQSRLLRGLCKGLRRAWAKKIPAD